MSSPTGPGHGLPVRMPRPRQPGRHRRPEPVTAPDDAPALVLAVPGGPSEESRALAEEVASIARSELPGLDARIGFVEERRADAEAPRPAEEAPGAEAADASQATETFASSPALPSLREVLTGLAARRADPDRDVPAVVVPLLANPDAAQLRLIRQVVLDSGSGAELTDVLGPHPLLAEGVHVRLSEAGLARADRARLFTVATAADGIILVTVGGQEAVQAAGITGMLLSARLAVPVLAAALDEEGSVAQTARQLTEAGSQQLALAPCLIGPEIPEGLLAEAAKEAGCAAAEPLAAYPAVGKLVLSAYMAKVGIAPQHPTQGTPVR
ncbi:hypothetical protein [Streptomyces hoynatensis]|uniref:Cobalamin biosynthesis protein CbiX n=1 Tax=Streptomyces hoynatensis TaxID=1141874 RepID=A0A3A9YTE1_9ACTN|nr:hypothetical protein [Streptomyces hoynatensis]RKN38567.1 hypothetical protein D7294_24170 [Streptomyces hoynatensis]